MTAAEKPQIALVRDADEYPEQIAATRMTAEWIVQMPLEMLAKRANEESSFATLRKTSDDDRRRMRTDCEILAVLAFAQKQLRKIETRKGR